MADRVAFITGATGVVGPCLVDELLGAGYRVKALVRHPERHTLPESVEVVKGDLSDEEALVQGVDGAQVVFHLAALLHLNDPRPEMQAQYRKINVEGTRTLVEAARRARVERFVFFSTINVYGASVPGQVWTENDTPAPATLYARTKLEAEELVRALPGATVLRPGAVYGRGMKGNYPLLARVLGRGIRLMVGDGRNRRSLIHVADAARAARLVAEHPDAAGETFNLTDGDVHTFDAIARAMQGAMGRTAGLAYVPAAPVRTLLTGVQKLAHLVGRRFSGPLLVDKLVEDVAVSGAKLREVVGFTPSYTLSAGWRAALDAPAGEVIR